MRGQCWAFDGHAYTQTGITPVFGRPGLGFKLDGVTEPCETYVSFFEPHTSCFMVAVSTPARDRDAPAVHYAKLPLPFRLPLYPEGAPVGIVRVSGAWDGAAAGGPPKQLYLGPPPEFFVPKAIAELDKDDIYAVSKGFETIKSTEMVFQDAFDGMWKVAQAETRDVAQDEACEEADFGDDVGPALEKLLQRAAKQNHKVQDEERKTRVDEDEDDDVLLDANTGLINNSSDEDADQEDDLDQGSGSSNEESGEEDDSDEGSNMEDEDFVP